MNAHPRAASLFITATGTGVGKTVITGALFLAFQQRGRSVGVMKPIETGIHPDRKDQSDTGRLHSLLVPTTPWDSVCSYGYELPLAPLACARQTNVHIDVNRILNQLGEVSQQYSLVLIEGAGGLLTPISPNQTLKDLISALDIPCLIVSGTDLGAVNHSLLTVSSLQHADIPTWGIVLNETSSADACSMTRQQRTTTCELIREFSAVPVFGPMPYAERVVSNWREGVQQLSLHPEIQRLATFLLEKVP